MSIFTPDRGRRINVPILLIPAHKIMLDADSAALYGVSTARLNQAVNRNRKRFPPNLVYLSPALSLSKGHAKSAQKRGFFTPQDKLS
jgi:hypothetical protein